MHIYAGTEEQQRKRSEIADYVVQELVEDFKEMVSFRQLDRILEYSVPEEELEFIYDMVSDKIRKVKYVD